jgi:ribonuclease Z
MSICVVFLGTGGSVPTNARGLPAILVQRQDEHIMFDCGEGVQRQMIKAKISFHKKMIILITHMHGDHILGLPGLLQTMALMDRQRPIEIYGPKGIAQFLEANKESLQFALTFEIHVKEIITEGIIAEKDEYKIEAIASNHAIPGFAYSLLEKPRPGKFYPEKAKALRIPKGELWSKLQHGTSITLANGKTVNPSDVTGPPRKGRKIVYTGDTRPIVNFQTFAKNADLLIHESTFDDSLAEKASEDGHSTSSQAANAAAGAEAKALILTHLSARYSYPALLLEQAKKIFKNTLIAEDFLEVELPL